MANSSEENNKLTPTKAHSKRATSYDVARVAGVSQSAVSRCFKEGASVSPKMKAKVLRVAKELGYSPNAIARGLISGRSNIVAVILTDLTNLNYPEVLFELNKRFAEVGVHILLFTLHRESDVDTVLDQVWQYRVDGIVAAAQFSPDQIEACEERGIPLVFYNRIYPHSAVSSVCCDHEEGERELVEGLLESGRKSFIVMNGPKDSAVSTARARGAISCLQSKDATFEVVEGDYSYETAGELIRSSLAKKGERPDAIVCANDIMAIGCIDTIRTEFGISIPDEIAVVGFDGISAAFWSSYNLTTVVQPVKRMVFAAVNMLMERIEDPLLPAEKRLFAGEVRKGKSAEIC